MYFLKQKHVTDKKLIKNSTLLCCRWNFQPPTPADSKHSQSRTKRDEKEAAFMAVLVDGGGGDGGWTNFTTGKERGRLFLLLFYDAMCS